MNHLTNLLPDSFVTALGWTLLHSLWQGAVIALLTGLALVLLRKYPAAVRYLVTLTALCATLSVAIFTFLRYYPAPGRAGQLASAMAGSPEISVIATAEASETKYLTTVVAQFTGYFANHFPLLVTAWAVGVLVLLLRFAGGVALVQRLKSYQTGPAAGQWQEKADGMARRMGLHKTVRLLESGLAKVPMTIGYLKPVILLPAGTLTGLPPAQLEAILAHELAHICRHDYLANLLQSLIEILLFFNPAVWWLSARVREEREHCCDDMAVSVCGDSLTFALALVHLQNWYTNPGAPAGALAVTGTRGMLLGRIKRLMDQPRRSPGFIEGFIVAGVLLLGIATVSVSASASLNGVSRQEKQTASAAPLFVEAEAPLVEEAGERSALHLQWSDSTNRRPDVVIVQDKKGKITELYVDGRQIRQKDIKNYQGRIDEALAERKKARYSDNPDQDIQTALHRIEKNRIEERREIYESLGDYAPPMPSVPPLPGLPAPPAPPMAAMPPMPPLIEGDEARIEWTNEDTPEKILKELNRMQKELHETQRKAIEQSRLKEELSGQLNGERQRELHQQLEEMLKIQQVKHDSIMREHARRMSGHEASMKAHEAEMKKHAIRMEKHAAFMKTIGNQLVKDGLAKAGQKIDFRMENGQLHINDQLQPAEVFRKYQQLIREEERKSGEKMTEDKDIRFHLKLNN